MRIIVGLGNPGTKYEQTRHNAGFMLVDELARQKNLAWHEHKKFKAEIAEDGDTILVKPLTFMNNSGESVAAIMRYYKLLPKTIFGTKKDADLASILTVAHDELDIAFGNFKITSNSSGAGHNGVQSIIAHLKTKNFTRVKIGIDIPGRRVMPSDKFVLQKFSEEETVKLGKLLQEINEKIS